MPPALETWSLNHWTARKVQEIIESQELLTLNKVISAGSLGNRDTLALHQEECLSPLTNSNQVSQKHHTDPITPGRVKNETNIPKTLRTHQE